MKTLTILFITISLSLSAQIRQATKKAVRDTVKVNAYQLSKLEEIQKKVAELNEEYAKSLELIIGCRREEIDSIDFKGTYFVIKKKQ